MAKPKVFISHRWAYKGDYDSLVNKFRDNDFAYLDYSVPEHDPLDVMRVSLIKLALREQIRQCNYFIVFANMAMYNSKWCKYEVEAATELNKPILSVKPFGYTGNVPEYIQTADTEGGPVGFNTLSIIKRIKERLGIQY